MPGKYGVIQDNYCYPDSSVLINKLGITDQFLLDMAELEFTQFRVEQYEPDFEDFSWTSLLRIHFLLFQDIYCWAGEMTSVKGQPVLQMCNSLKKRPSSYLISLDKKDF